MFTKKPKDLDGVRFGNYTATNIMERFNGNLKRLCICDCGVEQYVVTSSLLGGYSNGCRRCGNIKMQKQNGDSKKDSQHNGVYVSYRAMLGRCYQPSTNNYNLYGGAGITVCNEWKESYLEFKEWSMLNGWEEGFVISRIGDIGNYEPNNCKWQSKLDNAREAHLGKQNSFRILSDDDVRYIRNVKLDGGRWNKNGLTRRKIAEMYGLTWQSINAIRCRKYYKDVKDDI